MVLKSYSLDYEDAMDMHDSFYLSDLQIRDMFGLRPGEYFHDALIRYVAEHGGKALDNKIRTLN